MYFYEHNVWKNMEESSACKGVASIATNQWGTEISMKNTEVLEAIDNSLGYPIIMKSTKVQNPRCIPAYQANNAHVLATPRGVAVLPSQFLPLRGLAASIHA